MRRPLGLFLGLLLVVSVLAAAVLSVPVAAEAARLPSKATWERQNARIMKGSVEVLRQRVAAAAPGERLAINLDIDNTSLATYYAPGSPVRPTLRLAQVARSLGVAVVFNTGRRGSALARADSELRAARFPVDRICGHTPGTTLAGGKQACRRQLVADGYTIVVNVGNLPSDFTGGDYERRYKLRSYGGRLG